MNRELGRDLGEKGIIVFADVIQYVFNFKIVVPYFAHEFGLLKCHSR